MSILNENGQAAVELPKAKCPACESQPLGFVENVLTTNTGLVVGMLWCGKCGHVLTMQIMGMAQPMAGVDLKALAQQLGAGKKFQ